MKLKIQTRVACLAILSAGLRVTGAMELNVERTAPSATPEKSRTAVVTGLHTGPLQPGPVPAGSLPLVRRALKYSPHVWSEEGIHRLARGIDRAAGETGMPPRVLIAMILVESHFRPGISRRNRNGSIDYGLTQQNSRYAFRRCRLVYGRSCTATELLDPAVSLRLMTFTLNTCGRVFRRTAERVLCYNSWRRAYAFRRTGIRPRYLKKFDLELGRLGGTRI